jgi:hypothetical protein
MSSEPLNAEDAPPGSYFVRWKSDDQTFHHVLEPIDLAEYLASDPLVETREEAENVLRLKAESYRKRTERERDYFPDFAPPRGPINFRKPPTTRYRRIDADGVSCA